MAGRSLGMWVTAMAVFSSTLSGFGFVGGPGLVYRMGMSSIWIVICATVGHALKFYLLGKRIRVFSEVYQPNSLADVVAIRYGSQTTRVLMSLAILAGVMSYLGAQILAMATVLQQLMSDNNGSQWTLEWCVALSTAVLVFLAMRTLVLQGQHPELSIADAAAPQFLQYYAHPVLAGIVFAALFAAIMSTADGFLNIGAAAMVHDIPQAFRGRSLNRELLWVRVATVVMAMVAALFALYSPFTLVALLGKYAWGVFAAACVPVVAIGFNWKRANALAANTAIICGLLMNAGVLLAEACGVSISYGIDSSALTLLLSLVIFIVVSLLSPHQPLPDDVRQVMEI